MEFPVWSLMGTGAGLFLFGRGFRAWKRLRLIEDTPTSRVRSMALGQVELEGRAHHETPLEAPLTGTACVYYRYLIEQEVSQGRRRTWKTLAAGDSSDRCFYLQDQTGHILVDPRRARVDLPHHWRQTNPTLTAPLLTFLASQSIDPHGWLFSKTLRFTEWCITSGDPLYVLGVAQERPGLAREERRRIAERLAAVKRDPQTLAAFDANRDGRIDTEEWEVARQQAVREARMAGVDDRVMVGAAPSGEVPFFIANAPEARVLSKHRLEAIGGIWGGAALAVVCAASLFHRLELLGRIVSP